MATAKQIQARKRFKEVVAEAKKLRSKNPKLSQAQAVKQAWAIEYNVAGKTKTKKQVRSVGSTFNVGDKVKISKEYGGGTGTIQEMRGSFFTIEKTNGKLEYHHESHLTKIKLNNMKKVGAMSSENFDRMDSLTSIPELRKFTYAAGAIIQDLFDEGFETYEIKEYLIINLQNILKRF